MVLVQISAQLLPVITANLFSMYVYFLVVCWFSKGFSTGHSEKKKKKQTEEEMGGQLRRVDRNGLCQLN